MTEPATSWTATLSAFFKKEVMFFFVDLAQVVPVVFAELPLHLFYYFLHRQPGFTLSIYEASKVVIAATLHDIGDQLAQVLVLATAHWLYALTWALRADFVAFVFSACSLWVVWYSAILFNKLLSYLLRSEANKVTCVYHYCCARLSDHQLFNLKRKLLNLWPLRFFLKLNFG